MSDQVQRPLASKTYRAVIFDLDGTLLDTLEDIATAANDVLSELEKPTHSIEAYKTLVGDGVSVLFQRALPETQCNATLLEDCIRRFQVTYGKRWNNRSRPYNGIDDLLSFIQASGMPMAILSNKPDAFTQECVSHLLGHYHFAMVLGQKDGIPRKPDPAGVHIIARKLGVSTDCIAYVGDTNTDMETAVASGCDAIGVSWGFRSVDELRLSGANWIVNHPLELKKLLS